MWHLRETAIAKAAAGAPGQLPGTHNKGYQQGDDMKLGMLWFDDDPKTDLAGKIARAAAYYEIKHGKQPNMCHVHPSTENTPTAVNGIAIEPNPAIGAHCLWIGQAEL
jgi:hypothetical protein